MESFKDFISRLLLEALNNQGQVVIEAPDRTSVTLDGEFNLDKIAEFLLANGIEVIG